jgi:PAS domain S-box-containing protein
MDATIRVHDHPIAHVAFAVDDGIEFINAAGRRLFGLRPNDPVEQWADLFSEAPPQIPVGDVPLVATVLLRRGTRHVLRLWQVAEIVGSPKRRVVALEDVSRLQATLVQLEESETSFRDMAENVPGALFRYLLRKDGSDAVLYMSPRCLDLWEVPAERVMEDASPLWEVVHPDDLPAMAGSVQTSAATLDAWFHEWRITTASGKRKWLQGSGRPRRLGNGDTVWNSLILDVSERKAKEESERLLRAQLRSAQQLDALGRLAGGIAHDFNNLLTVILGTADVAIDEAVPGTPMADLLAEIRLAADRSAALTRQLLAFARQQPGDVTSVVLPAHFRRLLPLLRRVLGEASVLDDALPETLPPIRIDPVQLDQVFANLVVNARDAMPDGGRVTVEARLLEDTTMVELVVRDTGRGMTAETRDRIFEPFFSTKSAERGTGLGMSIVFGVIRQAGGTIQVESVVGQGTTFRLRFPVAPAQGAESAAPVPSGNDGHRATARLRAEQPVLVIEDDEQVRRFVVRTLQEAGLDVLGFASGSEALAAGPTSSLIVSDVRMPGMSGPEFLQRYSERVGRVPVLFMSGYVGDQATLAALEAHSDRVLAKPFTAHQLLEHVAQTLGVKPE